MWQSRFSHGWFLWVAQIRNVTGALWLAWTEYHVCALYTVPHLQKMLYLPDASTVTSNLPAQRKLDTVLCNRPTILMLCLDNTLLMQMAVVLATDMNANKVRSFPSGVFNSGELMVKWICQLLYTLSEDVLEEFQFFVETVWLWLWPCVPKW